MKKKLLGLVVLAALVAPVWSEDPASPGIDRKVGAALMESMAQLFGRMGGQTVYTKEERLRAIEDFLIQSMQEARKARDLNQIDPVFFARYQRLLGIIKMTMAPDPAGILVPVLNQEVKRFIFEVLGEDYKGTGPGALGQVANAIADEMINLQLHLDNVETKARLRKAFDEKFSLIMPQKEATPAPKTSPEEKPRTAALVVRQDFGAYTERMPTIGIGSEFIIGGFLATSLLDAVAARYPGAVAIEKMPDPGAYDVVIEVSIDRKGSGSRKFGWESGPPVVEKPASVESETDPPRPIPPPSFYSVRKGEQPYIYVLALSAKIYDGRSMKILTDKKIEGYGFFFAPVNRSMPELNKPMADSLVSAVKKATGRFSVLIK